MRKIECMIIDDEPNAVKLIEEYVKKLPQLALVQSCYDGAEALSILNDRSVDLIFMDINMPKVNGIDLACTLKPHQQVIFTTAYSQYALESYEYNAVDYLLKPISFQRFIKAVSKIKMVVKQESATEGGVENESYIFIKSDKKMIKLFYRDILFFEALKEYICVHTKTQKLLIYKRMKDLADRLPEGFIRVHNSFIVNCGFISRTEGNHIMINNVVIPVSATYKDTFQKFIQENQL